MSQIVWLPRGKALSRLADHERRAAHRLDAAGDEEVAVARGDRVAGGDDGREPGRAEPVDGHARDRLGQPREQRGHPRDVAVVLARLVRAAEVDVLDLGRVHARALDRRGDHLAARSSGRTPESAPP